MKTLKTMKSIVIATSIILASVSTISNAGVYSFNSQASSNTFVMNVAQSKKAAYQLGLNKMEKLKALNSNKLSLALNIFENIEGNSLHLNDSFYITVQERMDATGSIGYVGILNLGFHYLKPAIGDNS